MNNKSTEESLGLVPTAAMAWWNEREPAYQNLLHVYHYPNWKQPSSKGIIIEIWIKEVVTKWWKLFHGLEQMQKASDLRGETTTPKQLAGEEIALIYLKEHTVKEESGTKDEYNGMPWENNGQRESLEPPTEEKDTPVEGTPLSILAEELKSYGIRKHLNVNDFGYSEAERRICNRIISWQKEQDREVIQTLLDALNKVKRIENAAFKLPGFNPELLKADLQSAITKAEKFLQGKS